MTDVYVTESKEFMVSARETDAGVDFQIDHWDGDTLTCRLDELPTLIEALVDLAEFFDIPLDLR